MLDKPKPKPKPKPKSNLKSDIEGRLDDIESKIDEINTTVNLLASGIEKSVDEMNMNMDKMMSLMKSELEKSVVALTDYFDNKEPTVATSKKAIDYSQITNLIKSCTDNHSIMMLDEYVKNNETLTVS